MMDQKLVICMLQPLEPPRGAALLPYSADLPVYLGYVHRQPKGRALEPPAHSTQQPPPRDGQAVSPGALRLKLSSLGGHTFAVLGLPRPAARCLQPTW